MPGCSFQLADNETMLQGTPYRTFVHRTHQNTTHRTFQVPFPFASISVCRHSDVAQLHIVSNDAALSLFSKLLCI